MKKFVIGDIHGEWDKLKLVLQKSDFNKEEDLLVTLGDYVDRGENSFEVVEELLTIKNRISLMGNHDCWFLEFIKTGKHPGGSYGTKTIESYENNDSSYGINLIPQTHKEFFESLLPYHIDDENRCFVHGGFNRHYKIDEQYMKDIYWWDRDLFGLALSHPKGHKLKTKENFTEIYVGHSPTQLWFQDTPMNANIMWNMDTGCGKRNINGMETKLTIMNLETKEYWQSN